MTLEKSKASIVQTALVPSRVPVPRPRRPLRRLFFGMLGIVSTITLVLGTYAGGPLFALWLLPALYFFIEAGDGGVLDDVEELFFSLLRDLLRDTGEEEQSVSLKDEAEAMREAARAQDKATRGDLHRFMVAPSPFPVWVRGTDAEDALKALHRDFRRYVEAGFAAALDEDEVALTVIPLDGAHTYHHFPDWASNQ